MGNYHNTPYPIINIEYAAQINLIWIAHYDSHSDLQLMRTHFDSHFVQ